MVLDETPPTRSDEPQASGAKVQESRPKNTLISSIPPQLRWIAASDRRPREDPLAS